MYRLPRIIIVFVGCFLLASPQLNACSGVSSESTLFFNANAQPVIFELMGQKPSDAKGMNELPPDADVIAEVILTGANWGMDGVPTGVKIVKVIKTSDARISEGKEFPIKFEYTSCGPNHIMGEKGAIAGKIGKDIEDRLVLCLYSRVYGSGHIDSPVGSEYMSECNPDQLEKARKIKQAAEKGDVKAQISLGEMYEIGHSVGHDDAKAMKWFKRAAKSGDADAMYQLGAKYRRDKNDKEALKWFKRAAEKGHQYAVNVLDRHQKEEAIRKGAKKGNAEAQYELGQLYDRQVNYVEATKWYKLAAVQGHIKAANALGRIYNGGGGGVGFNHEEAAKWYRLTAEKGNKEGMMGLAEQYEFLDRYNDALKLYELAAAQGDTTAMERLGNFYQYGRGVARNSAEAAKWYRLFFERTDSSRLLVNLYLEDSSVANNAEEAQMWLHNAAARGYNVAQFTLGQMYEMGDKVKQDDAEAIKWYLLAGDQGNKWAKASLDEMEKQGRGVTANYEEVTNLLQQAVDGKVWRARDVLKTLKKSQDD
ncbi:sel1 repeat family protein [Deltaproteobacteria bacterium OttesenSCG-928-K17]|nr:sel1 repeat family protein [Deltaproteobacteria bacterium OttesenSCG-928-K17]